MDKMSSQPVLVVRSINPLDGCVVTAPNSGLTRGVVFDLLHGGQTVITERSAA